MLKQRWIGWTFDGLVTSLGAFRYARAASPAVAMMVFSVVALHGSGPAGGRFDSQVSLHSLSGASELFGSSADREYRQGPGFNSGFGTQPHSWLTSKLNDGSGWHWNGWGTRITPFWMEEWVNGSVKTCLLATHCLLS